MQPDHAVDGQWSEGHGAQLRSPEALTIDASGNLYLADTTGDLYFIDYPDAIRRIAADRAESTVTGAG